MRINKLTFALFYFFVSWNVSFVADKGKKQYNYIMTHKLDSKRELNQFIGFMPEVWYQCYSTPFGLRGLCLITDIDVKTKN